MDAMLRKLANIMEEEKLVRRGDAVIVGLSGGPDSVFLLQALSALREKFGFRLFAVHVHHGIRGEEADRDAAFSWKMAEELAVPFRLVRVPAPEYAEKHGLSLEEAARILRYRAFQEYRTALSEKEDVNTVWIAVAHHLDDQAETILHNFVRGSGMRGMAGMDVKRDFIIRPLLSIKREDILKWLKDQHIPYVFDSTNEDLQYTRNRIRQVVLPELQKINPEAALHICETAVMLREAETFFREKAEEYVKNHGTLAENAIALTAMKIPDDHVEKTIKLSVSELKKEAPLFRSYVMMELIRKLDVPLKDWTRRHFRDMDRLIFGPGNGHLDLPAKVSADYVKKHLIVSIHQDVISMKRRKNHGTACKSSDSGRGN